MRAIGSSVLATVAGLAMGSQALASVSSFNVVASASFTNRDSIASQGTAGNATGSFVIGAGGVANAVRVTGNLTSVIAGTFASEARVRFTSGAGNSFTGFNVQASGLGGFTGTIPVGPTAVPISPITLNAGSANVEWFESFDDGPGADSNWQNVTYEFGANTITNGTVNMGAIPATGTTVNYSGSHVAGGLDFVTFSVGGVGGAGDYLHIAMNAGATGSMTDTEIALYDSAGNFVATDDDGGPGLFSALTYGASDPLASPDKTPGFDGLTLPAGSYTLVTGGFNTTFPLTLGGTFIPGTNSGTYTLGLTYLPAPSTAGLLGLGGLVAGRRRRN